MMSISSDGDQSKTVESSSFKASTQSRMTLASASSFDFNLPTCPIQLAHSHQYVRTLLPLSSRSHLILPISTLCRITFQNFTNKYYRASFNITIFKKFAKFCCILDIAELIRTLVDDPRLLASKPFFRYTSISIYQKIDLRVSFR